MSTCKSALSRIVVIENDNLRNDSNTADMTLTAETSRYTWETILFALSSLCGPECINTTKVNCAPNSIVFSINKLQDIPEITKAHVVNNDASVLNRSAEHDNGIVCSAVLLQPKEESAKDINVDPSVGSTSCTVSVVEGIDNSNPFEVVDSTVPDCHIDASVSTVRTVVEDIVRKLCDVASGSSKSPIPASYGTFNEFDCKNDALSDVDDKEIDWSLHGGVDNDPTSSMDLKMLSHKCINNLKLYEPIPVVPCLRNNIGSSIWLSKSRLDVQGWSADHIHLTASTMQSCDGSICDENLNSTDKRCSNVVPWLDNGMCVLCHRLSADPGDFGSASPSHLEGRLLSLPGATTSSASVHVNCLIWSSGVFENKSGVLHGTASAIRRGSQLNCSFCGEKGATVGCEVVRCSHVYHLRCAIAAGCQMTELVSKNSQKGNETNNIKNGENTSILESVSNNQPGDGAWNENGPCPSFAASTAVSREERRTVTFCPEHTHVFASLGWKNASDSVVPKEPTREVIIGLDDWIPSLSATAVAVAGKISKANINLNEKSSAQHVIARLLLDHRICVRIGALTVHSVGIIALNSPWFHQADLIVPLGFESTRLFWSYKHPGKRTLYRFDVLSSTSRIFDNDLLTALTDSNGCIGNVSGGESTTADCSAYNSDDSLAPSSFPLYRVVAMDDQDHPYVALSAEECYVWMREQAKEALENRDLNALAASQKFGDLNLSLSAAFGDPVGRRTKRSGTRSESDDICQIRDVRLKALLFFGLGLDIVRIAIEMNRDSVVAMIPTLCFPTGRYISDSVVAEINECMRRLVESKQLSELQDFCEYNRKSLQVAVYKPRFLLPQRLSTVEVLRRLVSLRKAEPSGFSSVHTLTTESCSRSRIFSGKKYGGSTDDDVSEFAPLTAAASQLLSTSKSKGGGSARGRSLSKRTVEDESASILERLSSPSGYSEDVLNAPGTFNLSAERLQAKLEQDYWTMHDNNINEVEKHLAVQRSGIHGWGIYAQRDFAPNSMIVEYVGEQIRHTLADLREIQYERASGLSGSCYLFRLDKDLVVDATHVGGMARFLNHCCEPSCFAHIVTTGKERPSDIAVLNSPGGISMSGTDSEMTAPRIEQKHIVIMAARHIKVCFLQWYCMLSSLIELYYVF